MVFVDQSMSGRLTSPPIYIELLGYFAQSRLIYVVRLSMYSIGNEKCAENYDKRHNKFIF